MNDKQWPKLDCYVLDLTEEIEVKLFWVTDIQLGALLYLQYTCKNWICSLLMIDPCHNEVFNKHYQGRGHPIDLSEWNRRAWVGLSLNFGWLTFNHIRFEHWVLEHGHDIEIQTRKKKDEKKKLCSTMYWDCIGIVECWNTNTEKYKHGKIQTQIKTTITK